MAKPKTTAKRAATKRTATKRTAAKRTAAKRTSTSQPQQIIAVHGVEELMRVVGAKPKKLAGDCLRDCVPAAVLTLLSQLGELLTAPGTNGDRVVNAQTVGQLADLLVAAFHYDRDASIAMVSDAVTAWNQANHDDGGHTVPFV